MVRLKSESPHVHQAAGDSTLPAEPPELTPRELRLEIREKIDKLRETFPVKFGQFEKTRTHAEQKDVTENDLSPEEKEAANYKMYYDHLISTIMKLNDMYDWDDDYEEPDYKSLRPRRRKLCTWLYSRMCLNVVMILALVTSILEFLFVLGLAILPKTFVPALRYGSYVPVFILLLFSIHAIFHLYCFILGLSLHKIKSWEIGFVAPTWPFPFSVLPFVSLFLITVSWYASQDWRISREMYHHMALYNSHWFPTENWDSYQIMMRCCGITNYKDWQIYGPRFDLLSKKFLHIPQSCCSVSSCESGTVKDEEAYSMGCLTRTLISLKFLFSCAAVCLICNFILSVIAHLSVREAKRYIGDPLHTKFFRYFNGSEMGVRKMAPDYTFRGLNEKLDYYCYELGKHLGLGSIISDIDFDVSMEAVNNFLDFIDQHPKLWKEELALCAMQDITRYFDNIEMLRKNEKEAKDSELAATDLEPEITKNSVLDDPDEEENILEKSMVSPKTPGKLSSTPLEIAQVIHALEIHMGDQKRESTPLAVKLSTIFEEHEPENQPDSSDSDEETSGPNEKDDKQKDKNPEHREEKELYSTPRTPDIIERNSEEKEETIPSTPDTNKDEPMTPANEKTTAGPSAQESDLNMQDDKSIGGLKSSEDSPSTATMKFLDDNEHMKDDHSRET